MKAVTFALLLSFALIVAAQTAPSPSDVSVPDEATAIKIAEPALVKIYGKKQIENEKPLRAVLDGEVWHVYGTLCCPDGKGRRICEAGRCNGGVAEAKIRRSDGKILEITHTR